VRAFRASANGRRSDEPMTGDRGMTCSKGIEPLSSLVVAGHSHRSRQDRSHRSHPVGMTGARDQCRQQGAVKCRAPSSPILPLQRQVPYAGRAEPEIRNTATLVGPREAAVDHGGFREDGLPVEPTANLQLAESACAQPAIATSNRHGTVLSGGSCWIRGIPHRVPNPANPRHAGRAARSHAAIRKVPS
jgi:hypothetical protein